MANLFLVKSIETIMGEASETGEHTLQRSLGRGESCCAGYRCHYRDRHLCADGTGGGTVRGAGCGLLFHPGGYRMRVRGTLLCGVFGDDSRGGIGLHLWVCDARLKYLRGSLVGTWCWSTRLARRPSAPDGAAMC